MTAGHRHDVVVIGAGLAGLHAATVLEAQGLDVLVLEAQSRVGGRIHSMRQLGDNAEAGGTYIGTAYTRIMDTAAKHGIELIDVSPLLEFFREQDLVLDGEFIRQAEWPEHAANAFPDADKKLLPWNYHRVLTVRENPLGEPADWTDPRYAALDISMHDWLARLGLSEAAIKLAYGINTSFGSDAHDVSALLMLFRGAFSKVQRAQAPGESLGFTVERGVQRIPEAMAAALRREVALAHVVTAIESSANGVRLDCANGRSVKARWAICAVPFGVLRKIAMHPPMSDAQAEAVEQLPAQAVSQFYLSVKSPFWREDGYSPSLYTNSLAGMVAAARQADAPETVTHLTAWVMGANAAILDRLDTAEAGRQVIAAIERIRPAARGQLDLLAVQSWGRDPYAAGAWAYFRPGQVHRYAREIGLPHGKIHFCGEHLALRGRGMEGAMESGENAAQQILSTYAL
jgi:monoamine oxidase